MWQSANRTGWFGKFGEEGGGCAGSDGCTKVSVEVSYYTLVIF